MCDLLKHAQLAAMKQSMSVWSDQNEFMVHATQYFISPWNTAGAFNSGLTIVLGFFICSSYILVKLLDILQFCSSF